jgi:hypothetical protein
MVTSVEREFSSEEPPAIRNCAHFQICYFRLHFRLCYNRKFTVSVLAYLCQVRMSERPIRKTTLSRCRGQGYIATRRRALRDHFRCKGASQMSERGAGVNHTLKLTEQGPPELGIRFGYHR